MVAEQADQTDGEHAGDEEEKHDMKPSDAPVQVALPEPQEVAQRGHGHVNAVQQGVAEEQHEELVVAEVHAVIDPRTMVVHLQHANAAHAAMVRPVGLDHLAAVAEAIGARVRAIRDRQVLGHHLQYLLLLLLARGPRQLLEIS